MPLFDPRVLGARVSGLRRERVQASPRYGGGRFHNTLPLTSTLVPGQTLGQLMGMPMVTMMSLIKLEADDGRMRQLNQDLTRIDGERAKIDGQVVAYQRLRGTLSAELDSLRGTEAILTGVTDEVREVVVTGDDARLTAARRLLETTLKLRDNLAAQAGVVEELYVAADGLGLALASHVVALRQALYDADQRVEAARRATFELVRVMVSRDPEAAAGKWLSKELQRRVAARLKSGGLDGAVAKELAARLVPQAAREPFADGVRANLLD